MTQSELGKVLNLANNTISSWESDSNSLSVDKLNEVATLFNVPASYFFDETSESEQIYRTYSYLTVKQSVFLQI